ncbi:MAG TPA: glycosyl hydrolase family 2 [Vicinamibacteria bacterium]|nr:glycosyl hydrolase family 2 [Vicinamibacteria bacterium]
MHSSSRLALLSASSILLLAAAPFPATAQDLRLQLGEGWRIQSSAKVTAPGEALSRPGADTGGWHAATVPTTVVAALVTDGTYPDPHVGLNLRQIPGTSYEIGQNFSNLPMPADSPFAVPWWYRTEFTLPPSAQGRTVWLRFGGVNYRFDAWLNGKKIADAADTAGAWRIHELEVTGVAAPGRNALAVLVRAPNPDDLAITFVDWNPMPPDKVMGLYRPVTVSLSGPLALRHPQVATKLSPALDRAELTVKAFARNATRQPVHGVLQGRIGAIAFHKPVELAAGETREVSLTPAEFPQLVLQKPRLWWPAQYGPPALYTLELEILANGHLSDQSTSSFGVREVTAEKTPSGLVYKVNGRRILIRGAGYTPEMTLRSSPERELTEIRYVKDMGLNTIRLEGKLEDDPFFDATDREGVLVMPGWCCCDFWEKWDKWTPAHLPIATASLRDQILRLRGHASVFTWLNGSDNPPPADVEKAYLAVEQELGFPNPVVSSATEKKTELTGESGMKMRGPYEWVPPIYWYQDTKLGGPHGFATEIGPGPAPPPLSSLKAFLPADKLWPVNEAWNYHCGGGPFRNLDVFDAAMDARYGPPQGVEEYARKAQVAAYESHRAMLESFSARKYTATGIIQWMLNDAWPGMIWHLYDFYLRPGGSYFGAKKACEPLHVQYSYDDGSVLVVNSTLAEHHGLSVDARVVAVDGTEKAGREAKVDVGPDAVAKAFVVPAAEGLPATYFLFLTLKDASGMARSRNVYWLSTRPETLAWEKSQWYFTPVAQYADLTGLQQLGVAEVKARATYEGTGADGRVHLVLENPSKAVAFFLHASLSRPGGEEVLPVLWEDNDVTLRPGERRELVATFAARALGRGRPTVKVEGWNVAPLNATP